jgi:hypothetical protein
MASNLRLPILRRQLQQRQRIVFEPAISKSYGELSRPDESVELEYDGYEQNYAGPDLDRSAEQQLPGGSSLA